MMHRIRLLHISDLHARGHREGEAWRRRRVLGDSFWQNLDELKADGAFDLICFTGDLGDWGQPDEYAIVAAFLSELLERLGLAKDRLFLVPGNHDIARPVASDSWAQARAGLLGPDVQQAASRFMAGGTAPIGVNAGVRDAVLQRQGAYRQFLVDFGLRAQLPEASPHGRLGYRICLRLPSHPFDVHLVGLDSSWLCGDNHDAGKLLLTEDQVMRLCTDTTGRELPGVRIALLHHPLTDLADGPHCRRLLADHVDLLLRGHLHSAESELWADPDRRLPQLAAGCLYEGHAADSYPNACQAVTVHVDDTGRPQRFDLRFRAFSPRGGHWHDDGSLYRAAQFGRLSISADGQVIVPALPKHFHVPLDENPYFTGRDDLLRALRSALTTQRIAAVTQPQAISGLGGIGKTQLALAYALREQHRYEAVLWVRADSEDSLRSGFTDMADRLGLLGPDDKQSLDDCVARFKQWLTTAEHVLLICDGADSPEVLRRFLPRRVQGHVLLTSRAQDFQSLGIVRPIEVLELSLTESVQFLLRRTGREELQQADVSGAQLAERFAAEELAKELGRLPLALEQAAAYIVAKAVSFAEYLTSYKHQRLRLLSRSEPMMGDYPQTVATTWLLNFEQIKHTASAVALLRFAAFLAPDAIPIELLRDGAALFDPRLEQQVKRAQTEPVVWGELLAPLLRYSLVRRDRDAQTISIHRMVQEVVRDSIHADDRRVYAWRTVQAVNAAFPDPARVSEWPRCERELHHALAALQHCETYCFDGELVAHLHNQVALYLDHRRQYGEAEQLFRKAIALRQRLEDAGRSTLTNRVSLAVNLCNLAALLDEQGRQGEAEAPILQAVQLLEQKEGPDSPYLAFPLSRHAGWLNRAGRHREIEPILQRAWKLAQGDRETLLKCGTDILTAQAVNALELGQMDQAERLFDMALAACEAIHGKDSPEYLQVSLQQGRLRREQGRYQDSSRQSAEALLETEKLFGREHPRYANAAGHHAKILIAQGKYADAKSLLESARAVWVSQPGDTHAELPSTLEDLATCHRHLAEYSEAARLAKEALRLAEVQHGQDSPTLWRYLNALGLIYLDQDLPEDAKHAFLRAMELAQKGTGKGLLTLSTLHNNLGLSYEAQGQLQDAVSEYEQSRRIAEDNLGHDHPDVSLSLHNLAGAYVSLGRYVDAKPLLEQALAGWRKAHGSAHHNVAVCLYRLAHVNQLLGDDAQAEHQLREALTVSENALGSEHPDFAQTLIAMGEHERTRGRHTAARAHYERALAIMRRAEASPVTIAAIEGRLAGCLGAEGRPAEAERLLRDSISQRETKLGPHHPSLALTLNELALCLRTQGQNEEAEQCLTRALALLESTPGQGGAQRATVLANLAALRQEQGSLDEATQLQKRAAEIRNELLGAAHPDAALSHAALGRLAILRGQPDEARQHLARAESAIAPGPLRAAAALNIGHTQHQMGDYKAAATTLLKALETAGAEHDPTVTEQLALLESLLINQMDQGDRNAADQTLGQIEKLLAQHPNASPSLQMLCAQAKATLLRYEGKLVEARKLLEQTLTASEQHRADPACVVHEITMLSNLAGILEAQNARAEAVTMYERARSLISLVSDQSTRERLELSSVANLANNLLSQGETAKAEALFVRARALREKVFGAQLPPQIVLLQQEATLASKQKEWPRARELLEQASTAARAEWSEQHPYWPILLRDLGQACLNLGDLTAAEQHAQQALACDEKAYGPMGLQLRVDLRLLARVATAGGDLENAVAYAERAAKISRGQLAKNPSAAFEDEATLSDRLRDAGQFEEDLAALERALAILKDFPKVATASVTAHLHLAKGVRYRELEQLPKALEAFGTAAQMFKAIPDLTDSDRHGLGSVHHAQGDCHFRREQFAEARDEYEEALRLRRSASVRNLREESRTLNNLGQLRIIGDDLTGAEPLLVEAVSLARQSRDVWTLFCATKSYASLLQWLERQPEAERLLSEILPLATAAFGADSDPVKELVQQLDELRTQDHGNTKPEHSP